MSSTQWNRWMPIVKSNTTAEIWAEMANNYHLEQAGPQTPLASAEATTTSAAAPPATVAAEVKVKTDPSATPNPAVPFAILRNAHEGLRGGE